MKWHHINMGFLVVTVAVGSASPSRATVVTILDPGAGVGSYPSIAVPPTGGALVAYYDSGNQDLKVARCTDTSCTQATLATLDSAGNVGRSTSIAIGADGRGIISYVDATTPALKVAHCSNDACSTATTTVVDATGVGPTSIAIGADGLPLVAYATNSGIKVAHCTVADCTQRTVATISPSVTSFVSLAIASNGRGLIAGNGVQSPFSSPPPAFYRCADVACSSATVAGAEAPLAIYYSDGPSLAIGGDGIPFVAYRAHTVDPTGDSVALVARRCQDAVCTSSALTGGYAVFADTIPVVGIQPNGFGWVLHDESPGRLRLRTCTDASCTTTVDSCHFGTDVDAWSLARAADGRPLSAVHLRTGGLAAVYDISESCALPHLDVADAGADESAGQVVFPVTLSAPVPFEVRVVYATSDGTAVGGSDFTDVFGTLTFAAGTTAASVSVPVFNDGLVEPAETFFLDLFGPVGAAIGDGHAVGLIVDPPPLQLTAGDCTAAEGDAGTNGCVLPVTLDRVSVQTVTVDYATGTLGTATSGVDYLATSGTLTFAPGVTSQTVSVSVVGDTTVEQDETFFVNLSNPTNGTLLDGTGQGTIVDDDAPSLSSLELTHASVFSAGLAARPGPVADQDFYRLSQAPYASYEIVADAVSGDLAPGLVVERLAEDNATVVQAASAVGTGSSVSMRWERRSGTTEDRQHIRVRSAGCTTDCGPDDVYRLRTYETTARIARFNNRDSQQTILLLQNPTAASIQGNVDFWDPSGSLLRTESFAIPPHGLLILATNTNLPGQSGSITITHNGAFGAIAGKAVALEPTTGFSFDSPLVYKPR